MPRNQFQRMVFAFLTVVVTVHAYVFYSLYVINGNTLMNVTGETSVLHAIADIIKRVNEINEEMSQLQK